MKNGLFRGKVKAGAWNDKGEPYGNGPKCCTCGELAAWGWHTGCARNKSGDLIVWIAESKWAKK